MQGLGEVKAEPVADEPIPKNKSKNNLKNRMEQKASRSASLKVK
jgi:hypothetical protein